MWEAASGGIRGGIRGGSEGSADGWEVRNSYLRIRRWDGLILAEGREPCGGLAEKRGCGGKGRR